MTYGAGEYTKITYVIKLRVQNIHKNGRSRENYRRNSKTTEDAR